MKRAEALRPLSREHLVALSVAKQMREAEDAEEGRRAFLDFWDPDGRRHFRCEDEVLLPAWALYGEVDPDAAARMQLDHHRLRCAALELAAGDPPLARVRAIGGELHDHVRFEERRLFGLIEADLDDRGLEQLGRELAAFEG